MPREDKAKYEPIILNSIDDLTVDGEAVEMDLTEDAWEFGAPPPAGDYDYKVFIAKNGIQALYEKPETNEGLYINFNLECRIVNSQGGEHDDFPVFKTISTRIYRGKRISTMMGFLMELGTTLAGGKPIPSKISPKQLGKLCQAVIKREPIIRGDLDWRGAYSYKDKNGNDVWENVYNHYHQFPNDPDDKTKKMHIVEVTSKGGGKAEVRAQTQINVFYGKVHGPKKEKGLVSSPRQKAQVANVPEPELEPVGMKIATNASPQVPVSGGEGELDLVLE